MYTFFLLKWLVHDCGCPYYIPSIDCLCNFGYILTYCHVFVVFLLFFFATSVSLFLRGLFMYLDVSWLSNLFSRFRNERVLYITITDSSVLCQNNYHWGQKLSLDVSEIWDNWSRALSSCFRVTVSRSSCTAEGTSCELYGFLESTGGEILSRFTGYQYYTTRSSRTTWSSFNTM